MCQEKHHLNGLDSKIVKYPTLRIFEELSPRVKSKLTVWSCLITKSCILTVMSTECVFVFFTTMPQCLCWLFWTVFLKTVLPWPCLLSVYICTLAPVEDANPTLNGLVIIYPFMDHDHCRSKRQHRDFNPTECPWSRQLATDIVSLGLCFMYNHFTVHLHYMQNT